MIKHFPFSLFLAEVLLLSPSLATQSPPSLLYLHGLPQLGLQLGSERAREGESGRECWEGGSE